MRRSASLFGAFSLLALLLAARPLAGPRRDFAEQYRPDRRVQLDTRREADSLRVYLRFPTGNSLRAKQPLRLIAWQNYDARRPVWQDSVHHLAQHVRRLGDEALVEFCLPVSQVPAGQVVNVRSGSSTADDNGEGAWLEVTPERLSRSFILRDSVGQPLLRRYVRVGEVFQVDSYGTEQPLTAKQYGTAFSAALPPMTNPATLPPAARTMSVVDSLAIPAGRLIKLAGEGLYALRVSGSPKPLGLLAQSNRFPELTSAAELIQPLIYLTTSAERKKLYGAPDPKRAVDRFWLDLAGGQQVVARQLIRTYYGRVADASRLFTNYKAGWMTDRGMLYVVYGPPETVYRTAGEERWIYREGTTGAGTYTFRPKPSTFAPENYELVRRPEYEQLWYAAVEQWRKGLTAPTAR